MARTRAKGGSAAKSSSSTKTSSGVSRFTLPADSENPPKVFILPEEASAESRVVSLPHPRYTKPARYLVCPETGIYEFTRISAPKTTPRSWLIEEDGSTTGGAANEEEASQETTEDNRREEIQGQVTKDADLFVASPMDALFLTLPALGAQSSRSGEAPKRMFLTADDHFDALSGEASHLSEVTRWAPSVRGLLDARMAAICDTVDAGDETLFRLNESKLVEELLTKAKRLADSLPRSMSHKFVDKALEAPVQSLKSQVSSGTPATTGTPSQNEPSGASTPQTDSVESQSSVSTNESSVTSLSEASTAATSVMGDNGAETGAEVKAAMRASDEVVRLQKLRVSFSFICSRYVPKAIAEVMDRLLDDGKASVDFAALALYLAELAKLKQQAAAARSASDFSRKRTRDEEADDRLEKKRKKEEEEKKKKANESRGVRDLKKVNTSGMMKLSAFFKKK